MTRKPDWIKIAAMKLSIKKIDRILCEKGLKKSEVAKAAGMKPGWFSDIYTKIRARGDFQPFVVKQLADALGVESSEITLAEKKRE